MFSKDEYYHRRQKLIQTLGDGIYILPGYTLRVMSNDVDYEFRQQTDLLYFTGFPEPDSIAVIETIDGESTFTLFVPKRDKDFEIWNGRRYGTEGAIEKFNADEAFTNEEFEEQISTKLIQFEKVFYKQGENPEIDRIILNSMEVGSKSRSRKGRGPVILVNPTPEIHKIRAEKTDEEIKIMRKSANISADAMTLGMRVTKPGITERQVEAVIEYHYAKNHAERPAYPSIVGSGVNATILHYIENTEVLSDGDLLLVDAGAEYKGYSSDITRTWPINGKFSDPQKKVYQLVLDIQEYIIDMVRPGMSIQDLHDEAVQKISEGLMALGLLEGPLDHIVEEETYKRFFMHGLGHFLGIDVHDTSYVPGGRKFTLKPNHYFTVEPGIYIPDEEDIPEEYRGIGVRIEDDILVTSDGHENLTAGVVKSIEEIEKTVGTLELP